MITKEDIKQFFDLEAEASMKRWEEIIKLPIKERVRKRKAINDVYLDKEFDGMSEEHYRLLRVLVNVNLSDFKEGECLVLHTDSSISGIKCRLNAFEGEGAIILEVFPPDMPSNLEIYYNVPLVLDKDKVDLRYNVFIPFECQLPNAQDPFWRDLILNTLSNPTFENEEGCAKDLEETISSFGLHLLETQKEALLKAMSAKDYYLIQGPPGTGKSFVLGILMLEEILYLKHNVIVIGPNHMAINNAMGQYFKLIPEFSPLMIKIGQKYNAPNFKVKREDKEYCIDNIPFLNVDWAKTLFQEKGVNWLIGLTPHALYTRRARGLECDTLIIDEAGQMTVPLTLMGMIKAKKVIFAGDHKQLPPIISSDKIKDAMKQSAFQLLISECNHTMLDTSFRMCQPLCDFVSDLFYDGKLKAMKNGSDSKLICDDPLLSFDCPVVLHQINSKGEQTSDEEADYIANLICEFIKKGIEPEEIGVLSPFRAQAANIRRMIRKHPDIPKEMTQLITSDTIDKMQGQERDVIIYSLVSGNEDYIIEMADFLYNPNKMNVAFSRAKSKLIILGNIDKIKDLELKEYPHLSKMMNSKYITRV